MIKQGFLYRCDFCPVEAQVVVGFGSIFNDPMRPVLPEGWRIFDERLICPAHEIQVRPAAQQEAA